MIAAAAATTGAFDAPSGDARLSRGWFVALALGLWLVAAAGLLILCAPSIARGDYPDVDDALRLVQVRDWLAGQAFHDVTQYRITQPQGAPMHWSRLVDLPLAAIQLAVRPLLGATMAETVAAVAIPLVTLGCTMLLAGVIGRRLAGTGPGLLAVAMTACCWPALQQLRPLRVDHHGWTLAITLLAVCAMLDPRGRRSGAVAGLAAAVALQISLEALPVAAAIGAAIGLRWAFDPAVGNRDRLVAFAATLAAGEALLFALLHAPAAWAMAYCDAISPPQLAAIGIAAAGAGGLTRVAASQTVRFAGLAAIGIAAAAMLWLIPPQCGLDAFAALEPVTLKFWYNNVLEGRPIWHIPHVRAAFTLGFPLVGLVCAAAGWRTIPVERRPMWASYLVVLAAATATAVMVQRAGALANVVAAPVAAWAMFALGRVTLDARSALTRVLGTSLACVALTPVAPAIVVAAALGPDADATPSNAPSRPECAATSSIRRLDALPPSRLLAPVDLAPFIVFRTHHAPLASGHHRNHAAIADVATAFLGDDATAHRIVRARGLRYVVLCIDLGEIDIYRDAAPTGFAAQLARGQAPAWLEPVMIPGSPLRVWRVTG